MQIELFIFGINFEFFGHFFGTFANKEINLKTQN